MTELTFTSEMTVRTTRIEGADLDVACAAWVSTKGERVEDESNEERIAGLINFLARDRHGSPFEQVGMQWLVTAPIVVWREHMRHRIASYNEESGRYKKLDPVFYVPNEDRNLIQVGKPGAYTFEPGTQEQYLRQRTRLVNANAIAYQAYEDALEDGVAREVARLCLPVNLMSTAYVRMNGRAIMNFLSLRTGGRETAKFPSFPQREIEMVAEAYETAFAAAFPLTYTAFDLNGRVSP